MTQRLSVLVIDDDQLILDICFTALTRRGCRVITAHDGERGLEIMREQRPAVVLLDLMMPKKSGLEVLRDMKDLEETRGVPVLVLTNSTREDDRQEAERLGALKYLVKTDNGPEDIWQQIVKAAAAQSPAAGSAPSAGA